MEKWYSRTELLLGNEKTILLQNAHVMVVGIGGVGGMAAEMLCRSGCNYQQLHLFCLYLQLFYLSNRLYRCFAAWLILYG